MLVSGFCSHQLQITYWILNFMALFPIAKAIALLKATLRGLVFGVIMVSVAFAQEATPIDFSADSVTSNAETGIMVATGNVVFEQGTMMLTADKVEYDRNNGKAIASGNVVFIDDSGNTHYTDTLVLDDHFARAIAEPVISQLTDGSWVGAKSIDHSGQDGTTFETSRFTPCDCDFKNGETPAWELNTSESRHDPVTKTIYHHNVTMHIYSVPVMYFPYLSHPDWTVRRQSGLLPPRLSFSSDLGTVYAQSYYWVTGKTHDVEITPYIFSNEGEAVRTLYRQRWDQSALNARIYTGRLNTFKQDREDVAGIDADFTTVLADSWDANVKIQRASQDTFMRRYNFDESEELKLSILAEQISRTRYSRIEAYDTQDLTSDRDPDAEPTILPSIFHERYLDTSLEDLTLRLRLSAIQLDNDEATDLKRWSSELYARKDLATDYGNFEFESRLSAQYRDIETATDNSGYTGELGQGTASAGVGWSLPVAVSVLDRHAIFEPRLKFVTTKATDRTNKVPNRDSQDFRLDEANLFLLHREQGEDYNITNSRVDAGASLSMYDPYLGDVTGFVGSSVRVAGQTPDGLNAATDGDRHSDILANLTITPTSLYSISMYGRFHPRDLHLNETQIDASLYLPKTTLKASYTQLARSYFNSANEETEELTLTAYQDLGYQWTASGQLIYDMADGKRDLSESSVSVNYGGGLQDCLTVSIGYSRDTDSDRDIRPVDEVFLLFTFKHLGEVSSSSIK
jgi:LPS-assembly protein